MAAKIKMLFFANLVVSLVGVARPLGLGTYLFVKIFRPGDSEGSFSI